MEEADLLCDRLAIIDHGKSLALDTPEALKASTGADTVVTVIGRAWTDLDRPRPAAVDDGPRGRHRRAGHRLGLPRSPGAEPGHRCPALRRPSADDGRLHRRRPPVPEPTLETVFIDLTGKELRE